MMMIMTMIELPCESSVSKLVCIVIKVLSCSSLSLQSFPCHPSLHSHLANNNSDDDEGNDHDTILPMHVEEDELTLQDLIVAPVSKLTNLHNASL